MTGMTGMRGTPGMPFPRSLLFVPANRTEMFARAWESEAQGVIFDLEDSVPAAHKGAAREALVSLQPPDGWARPIYVRLNSYGTDAFDLDLHTVASMTAPLAGVMLPKVERATQVRDVDAAIAVHERPDRRLALILLIETPGGVLRVSELADCGVTRVTAFAFGAEDYRAGMRVDVLDPALADFARASVANAAAAAGVPAIDAPLLQVDDTDRLRDAARHARALGFHSKFAIHPSQVPFIHEAFAGGGDRAWALRAVEAYERAARDGHGSVALDGRMVDEATMKRARDILEA
jgi:citrate lyase subunit beta/citryl-CoA lyase